MHECSERLKVLVENDGYSHIQSLIYLRGQYVNSSCCMQTGAITQKKRNLVCCHAVHESVAMGKSLVGHIPSKENVADLMMKVFCGQKLNYLVSNALYDIHVDH